MCEWSLPRLTAAGWLLGCVVSLFPGCAASTDHASVEDRNSGGAINSNGSSPESGSGPTASSNAPIGGSKADTKPEASAPAFGGNATSATGGNASTSSVAGGTGITASTGSKVSASGGAGGTGVTATGGNGSPTDGSAGAGSTSSGASLAAVCGTFPTKPTPTGTLFTGGLEASGIVASRKQPGVYFMHGDSSPILYAIDSTGKELGQWEVKSSARFFFIYNWEDIAIQSMPTGPDRILIGDIGNHTEDNEGNPVEPRANLRLMSVDEPSIDPSQVVTGTVKVIDDFTFEYPDGLFDSEALMIDPATNDVFVVSKTAATPSKVYWLAAPLANSKLQYIGTLDADSINGGDISPSGREMVLRNYTYLYYWALPAGKSWKDVLSAEPSTPTKKSRLTFTQSYFTEAICFSLDESGLYGVSEEQPGTGVAPSPVEFYPKSCK